MRRLGAWAVIVLGLAYGMSAVVADEQAAQPDKGKPAMAAQPAKAAVAATATKTEAAVPKCPVTGKAIDKAQYSYFRGKRVYIADEAAKQKFDEKPDDYADGIKAQWELMRPLMVQVICPLTGRAMDMEVYVEGADARIYFADEEARRAWGKLDAKEQAKRLQKASTFQARCVTCDGDINPTIKRTIKGQDMYFCCDGCAKLAENEPDKYVPKCQEQIKENKRAYVMQQLGSRLPASGEKKP
ncbi:MAG: hypothetical protein JXO22_12120 [Phycisphaerae bacterium]|nr:hypothetical protein [Phycisphaerae bacterium]